MVLSYLFAQTLPWVNGQPGNLLVLASANVDEWYAPLTFNLPNLEAVANKLS